MLAREGGQDTKGFGNDDSLYASATHGGDASHTGQFSRAILHALLSLSIACKGFGGDLGVSLSTAPILLKSWRGLEHG